MGGRIYGGGMHIALVGAGRVGQITMFAILHEDFVTEISIADIIPGLAYAFGEELRHAAAGLDRHVEINAYESAAEVSGADIVIVTAGKPRTADMSRRDLTEANAKVMKIVAEQLAPNNPGARYLIVTNPVDAMAMIFKKVSKASFVISSGTNLETIRFRAELSKLLKVPIPDIEAYVAGEHGPRSVFLWSMTRINGVPFNEYVAEKGISLDRQGVENSVREVARKIIGTIGATQYGPASSFRMIVRSIALNEGRILPVAAPRRFEGIPEPVMVSVPMRVARTLGPDLWHALSEDEKRSIENAAREVYETYRQGAAVAGLL